MKDCIQKQLVGNLIGIEIYSKLGKIAKIGMDSRLKNNQS